MSNYSSLCLYKLAYVASKEVAHNKSIKFWEEAITKLGNKFFENKTAEALKCRWTKLMKEVASIISIKMMLLRHLQHARGGSMKLKKKQSPLKYRTLKQKKRLKNLSQWRHYHWIGG
jgi:hypothetical protein